MRKYILSAIVVIVLIILTVVFTYKNKEIETTETTVNTVTEYVEEGDKDFTVTENEQKEITQETLEVGTLEELLGE